MRVGTARTGLWTVLTIFVAGCATAGGSAYPDVAGSYRGALSLEGQGIEGTLDIVQDGGELDVVFIAEALGVEAEGRGRLGEDGSARVSLDYDLQCPGRAELEGDFVSSPTTFRGNVVAVDCTGEVSGTFSFTR